MTPLKALIVEDEEDAIIYLESQLKRCTIPVQIAYRFTGSEAVLSFADWSSVDLLFLDYEMPKLNALQLLEQLPPLSAPILFTTAHDEYVLDAMRHGAIDYLLKPIDLSELEAALQRVNETLEQRQTGQSSQPLQRLCIPTSHGFEIVDLNDLIWLESSNNYTFLHFAHMDKAILVSRSLRSFQNKLKDSPFIRVNQSTLINLHYVQSFDKRNGSSVILENGAEFTVSATYRHAFLRHFSEMML